MRDTLYLLWIWIRVHGRLDLPWNLGSYWELRATHRGPGRYYHTWHHIAQTMRFMDRYEVLAQTDLVRLALFFHDAVYDTTRKDNEQRSAEAWEAYVAEHGLGEPLGYYRCKAVSDMILMTQNHRPGPTALPHQFIMNDADMSIFLADPALYGDYARNIWREYQVVGEEAYVKGRLAFLDSLDPRTLFYTKEALALLDRAVLNIQWERDMLRRRPETVLRA